MKLKRFLAAAGMVMMTVSAHAEDSFLSNSIVSQPALSTHNFFVTDTAEQEKAKLIDLVLTHATQQSDLDVLLQHGVDVSVVNGLKLTMFVKTLPPEKQDEFYDFMMTIHQSNAQAALERRNTILAALGCLSVLFLGLFALSYFDRKKMRKSQKAA